MTYAEAIDAWDPRRRREVDATRVDRHHGGPLEPRKRDREACSPAAEAQQVRDRREPREVARLEVTDDARHDQGACHSREAHEREVPREAHAMPGQLGRVKVIAKER